MQQAQAMARSTSFFSLRQGWPGWLLLILLILPVPFSALAQTTVVDHFSTPSWQGGQGWDDAWYHEGLASVVSWGSPHSGAYHLCLRAGDAWVDRGITLSGASDIRLGLYVKVRSFERSDYADLMISTDGTEWETLRRFYPADSDGCYHYYEFDLSHLRSASQLFIGFEAEMSSFKDYLYVDDITLIEEGDEEEASGVEPIFGVTIDDLSNLAAIKTALASLARKPFARIVFDEYVPPAEYVTAVKQLHTVAGIMGELLDSTYVEEYSLAAYTRRARRYVQTLADQVDIWEVGNEINGEWLGQGAMAKAAAAYDIVKAAGEPAALTLYYNGTYDDGQATANNCWEQSSHQMQTWAEKNVPARMKSGLDWVLVSFYEEDCENISPDWEQVFSDLHTLFPNAQVGFGEVGTSRASMKTTILNRYYGMDRIRPEFFGGFFWWYFKQDMVPKTRSLWKKLNQHAQRWAEQYD